MDGNVSQPQGTYSGALVKGAAWNALFRIADRSFGIIATLVLVRILQPSDFGLLIMATSVIAVLELATAFGFEVALIQARVVNTSDYDCAWTMNLLLALLSAGFIVAIAVPVAQFYREPRLVPIMLALAAVHAIGGLENTGIVDFRRQLNFRRDFVFLITRRMAGFALTIPIAIMTQSYWALVAGTAGSKLTGVLLSFLMHPHRPGPTLANWRALMRFSRWTLATNLVIAGLLRLPHFFVGRLFSSESLGVYVIAADFAVLPVTEIAAPVNRSSAPAYARLSGQQDAFRAFFLYAAQLTVMLAMPAGVGLLMCAEPFVLLVLGDRWVDAIPIVRLLAVSGILVMMASNNGTAIIAIGHPHLNTVFLGVRLIALVIGMVLLAPAFGLLGIAFAEVAAAMLSLVVSSLTVFRRIGITWRTYIGGFWRIIVATGAMALMVGLFLKQQHSYGSGADRALALGGAVFVGAAVYAAVLVLLWIASGRPEGTERHAVEQIVAQFERLRCKWGL